MYVRFITAAVIAFFVPAIKGMSCYTCLGGSLRFNPFKTDNCSGPNISDKYLRPCQLATDVCVTISIHERMLNSTIIMRGCGHPHKSECENVKQKLFDNKYCIEKCSTEGCNSKPYTGGSKAPQTPNSAILTLLLFVFYINAFITQ